MLCYCPVEFPVVVSYCHIVFVILSYSMTFVLGYLVLPFHTLFFIYGIKSINQSIYLSIYQSIYLSIYLYLSSCIQFFYTYHKVLCPNHDPLFNLAVAVVLVYLHLPCWFPIRFGSTRVSVGSQCGRVGVAVFGLHTVKVRAMCTEPYSTAWMKNP